MSCRLENVGARFFEDGDHLLALYTGKTLEKIVDGIACLQVIEQAAHWHARAGEHAFSAKDLRVNAGGRGGTHGGRLALLLQTTSEDSAGGAQNCASRLTRKSVGLDAASSPNSHLPSPEKMPNPWTGKGNPYTREAGAMSASNCRDLPERDELSGLERRKNAK